MSAPVPDSAGLFGALGASLRRRAVGTPVDDREPGDTTCRNCGADAPGAYCAACGQETVIRLPTAGRFMRDAAGRYVALDGRMWRTLSALLLRPGFLTREYLAGRRRRYVRPSRLVLVLAIVLFAAVRAFTDFAAIVVLPRDVASGSASPAQQAADVPDVAVPGGRPAVATGDALPAPGNATAGLGIDRDLDVRLAGLASPFAERISRRLASFERLGSAEKGRELAAGMIRYGPYALIALLPAFALLMQGLYADRKRRHPARPGRYAEHLVFAAHNHAFVALCGTLLVAIPWAPLRWALVAWMLAYLLASMHAVYGGRWIGTIARAYVVLVSYAFLFVLAVAGLAVAAIVLR